ncbi:hypothetical protein FHR24_003122 [Wenyingzhuangia heitensis]|uniref:Addiction module component n=1 Tax=Wenyingzhuangia heitensis TaxID=1487859 RepID=A0ABX0UCR2_9FLAO|nr:hypothetical protein [Wenyingzhuangia heitensis]NIJ46627.1 hypothetical protein [Wenyingzhuangia heitensis]
MAAINTIKNNLIDRILATKNEKLLTAISNIFESTQSENQKIILESEQIEMLQLSDKDILEGNLISESDLNKLDQEWLA